jgi:hypothetical protein
VDHSEVKALSDIEEYGCHVLHVFEDDGSPRFTYSIGIQQCTKQPELIVTGLKQELAQSIINKYNQRIKSGEVFLSERMYSNFIEGFDVTFKIVSQNKYKEYLGWARWLYKGNNFSAYQLIFPSTSGKWPWDSDAPDDYTWFIPPLYES